MRYIHLFNLTYVNRHEMDENEMIFIILYRCCGYYIIRPREFHTYAIDHARRPAQDVYDRTRHQASGIYDVRNVILYYTPDRSEESCNNNNNIKMAFSCGDPLVRFARIVANSYFFFIITFRFIVRE